MKKVVKKMANGGAKKSYVPTPGMAYKEKGRANQLAMATGIPAGSKAIKPVVKVKPAVGVTRVYPEGIETTGKNVATSKYYNGNVVVKSKKGTSTKYNNGTIGFQGKKGLTQKNTKGETVYISNSTKKVYKKPSTPVVKKSTVKTPVTKKPVATTPAKTLTKLPEVTVTAKKKESTVAPKAKTVTKPTSGSATNKPAGKTVSQMWQEKTGTSWSEAKKQGLTDGSAKANMALMAKMKSNPETFSKRDAVPEKLATISLSKAAENLSPAKPTPELAKSSIPFKAGKSRLEKAVASKVGQMKKGGMVKKKK